MYPERFCRKTYCIEHFPSIDTSVCASSVRKFNEEAQQLRNTVVLYASLDLPFAHSRFCGAEGLDNVISVTELRKRAFGEDYGVRIVDGPLAGLLSRAVVIIDEHGKVLYTEQVREIAQEPNYKAALKSPEIRRILENSKNRVFQKPGFYLALRPFQKSNRCFSDFFEGKIRLAVRTSSIE